MKWRLLDTGQCSGSYNMAVDEAILLAHSRGQCPPTLRFYGWNPPALTLGYFQDPEETVDFEACRRLGVDVVRRPTGGRAVLHHHEVTYSVIARADNPVVHGSVAESYLRLSQALMLGLSRLGATVSLTRTGESGPRGAACFAQPAIYEIVAGGRKLAGNAQCRKHDCVLQHGALPLSNDDQTLFQLLKFGSEEERREQRLRFCRGATSLEEAAGCRISPSEVTAALTGAFAEVLGIETEPGGLTTGEIWIAEDLSKTKYASMVKKPVVNNFI